MGRFRRVLWPSSWTSLLKGSNGFFWPGPLRNPVVATSLLVVEGYMLLVWLVRHRSIWGHMILWDSWSLICITVINEILLFRAEPLSHVDRCFPYPNGTWPDQTRELSIYFSKYVIFCLLSHTLRYGLENDLLNSFYFYAYSSEDVPWL